MSVRFLRYLIVAILFACIPATLAAQLTVEIRGLESRRWRLSYSYSDSRIGSTTLATGPISLIADSFAVVSATEKNTQQRLPYEVFDTAAGRDRGPAARFTYSSPVPSGGNYRVEATFEGIADGSAIYQDPEGRWTYEIETNQTEVFFVLPRNHAIVYANFPILVYEREGRTVAQVRSDGRSKLLFKTRPFRNSTATRRPSTTP